ncbi:MAG: HAMP domain-containing histidine kinase [Lachnospiraceae bacterium]|nr:HAMP domain-containing histidine kinase [Lachnospiraceae bacterium]
MKRYNKIIAATFFLYLGIAVFMYFFFHDKRTGEDLSYKVEINEIMQGLEKEGEFSKPDLRGKVHIKEVCFLPVEYGDKEAEYEAVEDVQAFYQNHNGVNMTVKPLVAGEKIVGYVRFDYVTGENSDVFLWTMEGLLLLVCALTLALLLYIRHKILGPFNALSEMPYELAKGHLSLELKESKSRFFGKFVWGIAMLRDTLKASRNNELRLEKEKKLLLLSISHDIKIPLSAIKLYAKALREGIYESERQKHDAALQIENKAHEIEEFVKEIVSTASEDIFTIEVENLEFYLKDYIDKVRECYETECRLVMTDLTIGRYENKLLKGDIDCAFEVMENLMDNAFKYGDGKKIAIDFYEEDYCQIISVYSTGNMVSENEMPHLFDSFYRGSNINNKAGNGLGLYINRQIMLKMGGDIFAKRQEGGMSFCLVYARAINEEY